MQTSGTIFIIILSVIILLVILIFVMVCKKISHRTKDVEKWENDQINALTATK